MWDKQITNNIVSDAWQTARQALIEKWLKASLHEPSTSQIPDNIQGVVSIAPL
jgi:hypothetical protein